MLKYGIISEVDYSQGRARVFFDAQGITSGWLTLPNSSNLVRKYPINCQVAVQMHDNGEDGEILHRVITDEEKTPNWASDKTEGYKFSDGTAVYYNSDNKTLTIEAENSELIFKCKKLTVTGDVVAGIEKISLTTHTHTAPTGPTGMPIPKL